MGRYLTEESYQKVKALLGVGGGTGGGGHQIRAGTRLVSFVKVTGAESGGWHPCVAVTWNSDDEAYTEYSEAVASDANDGELTEDVIYLGIRYGTDDDGKSQFVVVGVAGGIGNTTHVYITGPAADGYYPCSSWKWTAAGFAADGPSGQCFEPNNRPLEEGVYYLARRGEDKPGDSEEDDPTPIYVTQEIEKLGCHLERDETTHKLLVTADTLIAPDGGLELVEGVSGEDCDTIAVIPGCHVVVDADGVSVTPDTLLAEDGGLELVEGECDTIGVKADCGITVGPGGVGVDVPALLGTGLVAGSGCSINVDPTIITGGGSAIFLALVNAILGRLCVEKDDVTGAVTGVFYVDADDVRVEVPECESGCSDTSEDYPCCCADGFDSVCVTLVNGTVFGSNLGTLEYTLALLEPGKFGLEGITAGGHTFNVYLECIDNEWILSFGETGDYATESMTIDSCDLFGLFCGGASSANYSHTHGVSGGGPCEA